MSALSVIAGNSSWIIADRLAKGAFVVVVDIALARSYGPEIFGAYSFATAFVAVFSVFSTLGLEVLSSKEYASKAPNGRDAVGSFLLIRTVGGCIGSLAAYALLMALYEPHDQGAIFAKIIALALIFRGVESIDLWYQVAHRAKTAFLIKFPVLFLFVLLKIYLIAYGFDLSYVLWASVVEWGVIGLVLIRGHLKSDEGRRLSASTTLLLQYAREGWPLALSAFGVIIYMKIDQLLVRMYLGYEAAGGYGAIVRVTEITYLLPGAVTISAASILVSARRRGESYYYRAITDLTKVLGITSGVIACAVSVFSEEIVSALYGERYVWAATTLSIHVWASFFVFIGIAQGLWFAYEGRTHIPAIKTFLSAAIGIGLNVMLIPIIGVSGAAISTLIAFACSALLLNALFVSTRPLFKAQIAALKPMNSARHSE